MSINHVSVTGNLTREPELRNTQSGTAVLSFDIAVNDRRKIADGQWEDVPNFFECVTFGNRATALSGILTKGMKVAIAGKLHYSSWETDGQRRSKVDIIAQEIELMQNRKPQQGQLGSKPVHADPATAPHPYQQQIGGMPQAVGPATGTIYNDDIPF